MKKLLFFFSVALITVQLSHAQQGMKPSPEITDAMNHLKFLEGNWQGIGSIQMGPQKHTFNQIETVSYKVNGTVLQIEGLGTASDNPNSIIHQAFAIIYFDAVTKKYLMKAFVANGNSVDADAWLNEKGAFVWSYKHPLAGDMRYTIQLTDNKWSEIGEMNRDGKGWVQFFEMTLDKK